MEEILNELELEESEDSKEETVDEAKDEDLDEAKEETNDNGETDYWAMIKGASVQKQLPAIFDNVLCGVRTTDGDRTDPKVERYLVTDEVRGWKGKVRDPNRKIGAVMRTADITDLFKLMNNKPKKKEAA